MKRASRIVLLLSASAIAVLSASCKPKPGASCKIELREYCTDDKHALACHDGKWEEIACKGADGCAKKGNDFVCDQSVAEDKEICNLPDDFVCTPDKKGMLQCVKHKWTFVQACLGTRGCALEAKRVTCDNSIAQPGDACREEEDYACSADMKAALVCRSNKFVQVNLCKGPKGCRITGDKTAGYKVECDDSIAAQGDACEKEEHFSCSNDERMILKCKGKKFEVEEKCRAKEKCQIRGGQVGCY
jgi:hypothetical protein